MRMQATSLRSVPDPCRSASLRVIQMPHDERKKQWRAIRRFDLQDMPSCERTLAKRKSSIFLNVEPVGSVTASRFARFRVTLKRSLLSDERRVYAHRTSSIWFRAISVISTSARATTAARKTGFARQSLRVPRTLVHTSTLADCSPWRDVCARPKQSTDERHVARTAASMKRSSISALFFGHRSGIRRLSHAFNVPWRLTRNTNQRRKHFPMWFTSSNSTATPNKALLPNWRDCRRFDGSLMILNSLTVVRVLPPPPAGELNRSPNSIAPS